MFNGLLSPIKKINRLISKCLKNSSPNLFLLQLKKTGLGGKVCFFIITFLSLKGIITF